jgi:hypothetical protein
VIVKPIATNQDVKVKPIKIDTGDNPTLITIDHGASRIGALEVQIYLKDEEKKVLVEKILHSKLKTGAWPNIALMLEKIHFFLPRVPKVTIQLFKEESGKVEELRGELKDMSITIKSSYNNTVS